MVDGGKISRFKIVVCGSDDQGLSAARDPELKFP